MDMNANVSLGVCREDRTVGVPEIGIARQRRDSHKSPVEERAIGKPDSSPGPRALAVPCDEPVERAIRIRVEAAVSTATHGVKELKGRIRERPDRPCCDARAHFGQWWCAQHASRAQLPGQLLHVPK